MKQSEIKFTFIDNKDFHRKLENVSQAVLHHLTMTCNMEIIPNTDATISVFRTLPKQADGKCY